MDSKLAKIRQSLNCIEKEYYLTNDEYIHHEQAINGGENIFTVKFPQPYNENIIIISYEGNGIINSIFTANDQFRAMCDCLILLKHFNKYYAFAIEFKGSNSSRHLKSEIEKGELQSKNGLVLLKYIVEVNRNCDSSLPEIIFGRFVIFKGESKKNSPNKPTFSSPESLFICPMRSNAKLNIGHIVTRAHRQNKSHKP